MDIEQIIFFPLTLELKIQCGNFLFEDKYWIPKLNLDRQGMTTLVIELIRSA